MAVYNPKSLKAEEFINHEEILETIKYAEENKNNIPLIDSILEKARPVKTAGGTRCAVCLTARRPCCWPAKFLKRWKKCISWPKR